MATTQKKYNMTSFLGFIVYEIPSTICFTTLYASLICVKLRVFTVQRNFKNLSHSPI